MHHRALTSRQCRSHHRVHWRWLPPPPPARRTRFARHRSRNRQRTGEAPKPATGEAYVSDSRIYLTVKTEERCSEAALLHCCKATLASGADLPQVKTRAHDEENYSPKLQITGQLPADRPRCQTKVTYSQCSHVSNTASERAREKCILSRETTSVVTQTSEYRAEFDR
jgi:hypothetical protein